MKTITRTSANDEIRWKKVEKVWTNLREFWWIWVWIWENELLMMNSITISALYHLLIHLVNMISNKWNGLVNCTCYVKMPKCPFSIRTNGTVKFLLQQIQISVLKWLALVWSENHVYFSKSPFFPPKFKLVHLKNGLLMWWFLMQCNDGLW